MTDIRLGDRPRTRYGMTAARFPTVFECALTFALVFSIANASGQAAVHVEPHAKMAANEKSGSVESNVRRSTAEYAIPNVTLVRDDGVKVDLPAELNDGRPLVVNFVYTSCTTICPMSSQVFEQFQSDLGADSAGVHLVSISIDPEQDTPGRLRAYARQFHARKSWNHYSGSLQSILAVQRAFDAYRGDKMSHLPLTLMRAAPGAPWVRIDGFARSDELLAERAKWSSASLAAR